MTPDRDAIRQRPRPELVEALRIRALALTGEVWERNATRDMMKEAAQMLEDLGAEVELELLKSHSRRPTMRIDWRHVAIVLVGSLIVSSLVVLLDGPIWMRFLASGMWGALSPWKVLRRTYGDPS